MSGKLNSAEPAIGIQRQKEDKDEEERLRFLQLLTDVNLIDKPAELVRQDVSALKLRLDSVGQSDLGD